MHSEFRELIAAAANMRDAANRLWHAHNPDEGQHDEVPMSLDDAQEKHSAAFMRLERAEYYAEKAISRLSA
ncbi:MULTISPECIES: hypothetical protein [Thiorhodovibrio]|uniref:hypothetical protein n=1 Tax=Thiorhodovibrio TaxID=61593 RepID=UPI00191391F2|nr:MULTISPECIES: hypothetical protein [Thiorhodovibrio]